MPWGMAEEAGFACHWLEQHSLPGTEMLAKLLLRYDENEGTDKLLTRVHVDENCEPLSPIATDFSANLLHYASNRTICPILLGTLVSDGLIGVADETGQELAFPVSQPGLLLPFFYLKYSNARDPVALRFRLAVTEEINNRNPQPCLLMLLHRFASDAQEEQHRASTIVQLLTTFEESVSEENSTAHSDRKKGKKQPRLINLLSADRTICQWQPASAHADTIDTKNLTRLNAQANQRVSKAAESGIIYLHALAARTYAPTTDESREKGAGAGTSDND